MAEKKPFKHLGVFPTFDEAVLAAEMNDALHGGTEPLDFHRPRMHSEPQPGHLYTIQEHVVITPRWRVRYTGPDGQWRRGFDSVEAAQAACQADWEQRQGEQTA